jgi:peptide subunit release factor 1 (eRF1)
MTQHTPRRIAIWVDHRTALLAVFTGEHLDQEDELHANTSAQAHGRGWAQHSFEAHRHAVLQHYYDEIVQHLGPVDEILILGPGQGKHELIQRIEHHRGLKGKVVGVQNADKMTEAELVARATDFFDPRSGLSTG